MKHTLALSLAALLFLHCQKNKPEEDGDSMKKVVTFAVLPGDSGAYWSGILRGMESAGQDLGINMLLWSPQAGPQTVASQRQAVSQAVNMKAAGLVLAPMEEFSLEGPVFKAVDEGISVVFIQNKITRIPQADYIFTSPKEEGRLAALELGKALMSKGLALALRTGLPPAAASEAAFFETMTAEFPGLKVQPIDLTPEQTFESAYAESEKALIIYPQTKGVFCSTIEGSGGMLKALRDINKTSQINLVGIGSSPDLIAALRAGEMTALIAPDAVEIGAATLRKMQKHTDASGHPLPDSVRPLILTPHNIHETENDYLWNRGIASGRETVVIDE